MTLKKDKNKKKQSEDFDFERYQAEVVVGLMSGKGMTGKDGLLKPLIARFVEAALDAEMTGHLKEEKANPIALPNKRNGQKNKQIRTQAGEIEINYSRDRPKASSWNKKIRGWSTIQRELIDTYGDRFTKHLN